MDKSKSFTERRRQLLVQTAASADPAPQDGEAHDDWNNFPNYFKFGSFANASVPEPKPVDKPGK